MSPVAPFHGRVVYHRAMGTLGSRVSSGIAALVLAGALPALHAQAQELEPRAYAPSPVGANFPAFKSVQELNDPWQVSFGPREGKFEKLVDWTQCADNAIKYFSGTATYTKSVDVPASWIKPGVHIWLDLGTVNNLAEVAVNGKNLGILWKQPYRVDVTPAMKPGTNVVEVKVTNGWANRIIGDRQPNANRQYTFTSPKFYTAKAPLWSSGLLGPVQLVQSTHAR